ncbi:MAG: hypothetical protein EON84_09575 [Bradyrhizobiaceae bacterium]|nr:MAG: hypothetical protein EON84_09575 [Bradyrhizobiaceae bacterium]
MNVVMLPHLDLYARSHRRSTIRHVRRMPGIHVLAAKRTGMDGRDKPGHDGAYLPARLRRWFTMPEKSTPPCPSLSKLS